MARKRDTERKAARIAKSATGLIESEWSSDTQPLFGITMDAMMIAPDNRRQGGINQSSLDTIRGEIRRIIENQLYVQVTTIKLSAVTLRSGAD